MPGSRAICRQPGPNRAPGPRGGAEAATHPGTSGIGHSLVAFLLITALAPIPARASVHSLPSADEAWPSVSRALRAAETPIEDVIDAARLDVAKQRIDRRAAPVAVGRFLVAATSDRVIRLDPQRGSAILARLQADPAFVHSFWSDFALATLQQLAGEDRAVVETLTHALDHARDEAVPPAIQARATGILGHVQQSSGLLGRARSTFEALRTDPFEDDHANRHLGALAARADGVEAGLEIWLSHPDGLAVGLTVIVDEADALWLVDAELSYRLVTAAIDRLRSLPDQRPGDGAALDAAIARLAARSRANAAPGATVAAAPDATH